MIKKKLYILYLYILYLWISSYPTLELLKIAVKYLSRFTRTENPKKQINIQIKQLSAI